MLTTVLTVAVLGFFFFILVFCFLVTIIAWIDMAEDER